MNHFKANVLCSVTHYLHIFSDVNDVRGFLVGGFVNLGNKQADVSHVASTILFCNALQWDHILRVAGNGWELNSWSDIQRLSHLLWESSFWNSEQVVYLVYFSYLLCFLSPEITIRHCRVLLLASYSGFLWDFLEEGYIFCKSYCCQLRFILKV